MSERTTCEVLTGPGRAAIAVIRLAGPESRAILSECFRTASDQPIRPGQVRYGQWSGASQSDDAIGESVVLVPLAEDQYEVHCHGGVAAVDRIREDMTRHGAVEPLDDLGCADHWLIAEAEAVLVECTAKQPARVAMEQVRGALSAWRDQAVQQLKENPDNMHTVSRSASEILESAAIGTRLSIPFDVVLAGRPNVGKSSLINAMVGYDRSIATDLAGTTRDVLDAETVLAGWPVRLRDTAGLHLSDQEIEREGIERAKHAI
ncbi:MAG: GTPase, partial [Planctomycetota bacterium]